MARFEGDIILKHTVYYIIPNEGVDIDELRENLNGPLAAQWMELYCQRTSNGYFRFQGRVIDDFLVPKEWSETYQATL